MVKVDQEPHELLSIYHEAIKAERELMWRYDAQSANGKKNREIKQEILGELSEAIYTRIEIEERVESYIMTRAPR